VTTLLSNRVATFTVERRTLLFILSAIACIFLATGIFRSSFDTSFSALLTESDPYVDELEQMEEQFLSPIQVTFAFTPPGSESVFSSNVLAAIDDLNQIYTNIPLAGRISSLVDYYSPEAQQRLFTKALNLYTDAELKSLEQTAISDRMLTANLLSQNAMITFALITLDSDATTATQRMAIADAALSVQTSLRERHSEVGVYVNSEVLMERSSQQAMVSDLTSLLPFVILACVLVICVCFRSIKLGACILSHTACTIVATIGLLGYLSMAFNNISIIAPLVVVIISVANSVHIISIYKQKLFAGHDSITAMKQSITCNFQPITLAALTTAIGFSSLNMSSSPAIQDFGRIVATGIVFAYVLTLTLLPAVLVRFSGNSSRDPKEEFPALHRLLKWVNTTTATKDRALFWSFTAFALITLMLLPLNETDFNRLDFIASDSDIIQYYDEVSARMNRGPALRYGIDSGAIDGAIEPEFLIRMDEFNNWLEEQSDVESIGSIIDIIKTVNRIQNSDDESFYVIPDNINVIATHLNNYEVVQSEDFPLLGFINDNFSALSLFINATPMSNQELIDLDERITERFNQQFPESTLIHGSGLLLFARMDELVTIELLQGYSISLLLITLTLIIGLRSIHYGILSVLPNLLPATMVFGIWALLVGQLDPFVMMLFSISIGLVVDDTVHILSHYLDSRQTGMNTQESINFAINTAGPALTITTLVLALGTTILIGASTLYFQQAAKLLVPIVVLALVLDLLYLPTILKRFDKRLAPQNTVTP
jgi:predicted RND superfamily exporter protein